MGVVFRHGITAGWGATGDRHVVLTSTDYKPNTKKGIIWCSPYESGAVNVVASGLASWWAQWGYPVVCLDLGQSRLGGVGGAASEWNGNDGPELWSSDTPLAALDTIWNTIFPAIGALSGPGVGKCFIAGGSGGGVKAVQWSRLHPDRVQKCLTIIGAVDLLACQQTRPNEIPNLGASITAALGNPVPDARNPAKAYLDWTPSHPPLRAQYSANDSVCLPSETLALVSAINAAGGNAVAIEQNQGNHDFYTGLTVDAAHWLIAN